MVSPLNNDDNPLRKVNGKPGTPGELVILLFALESGRQHELKIRRVIEPVHTFGFVSFFYASFRFAMLHFVWLRFISFCIVTFRFATFQFHFVLLRFISLLNETK